MYASHEDHTERQKADRVTDWAKLGGRILEAARMATAVHLARRAQGTATSGTAAEPSHVIQGG